MVIRKATFVTSIASADKIPTYSKPEFAMCGRSNVGKSSFINFICSNGKLAKTSKDPGRTRLINYFSCNDGEFYFVDLPGYGFARVSDNEKTKWGDLIESYLMTSRDIKSILFLLDIRHEPSEDDILMLNYLNHYAIPFTVIVTKADKLSKAEISRRKAEIAAFLKIGIDNIIVVSSLKKIGKEDVEKRLTELL